MLAEAITFSALLVLTAAAAPYLRSRLPLSADNVIRTIMPAPLVLMASGTLAVGDHGEAALAVAYVGVQMTAIACLFVPTRRSRWSRFERQFRAYATKAEHVRQ
ncbi:MAG TPA: hypothetical protein VF752_00300 [Thermoleophilaceae bacterium]